MRALSCVVILGLIVYVSSSSYFFGDMSDKLRLVHRANLVYQSIPLLKRIKTYEYKGPSNLMIKAIRCYDYQNSDASVNMTDGGVGTNHFTLRVKSQRSNKLNFEIEVYN